MRDGLDGREVLTAETDNLRPSPFTSPSCQDRSTHRAYFTQRASSAKLGFFPYISIPTR